VHPKGVAAAGFLDVELAVDVFDVIAPLGA
jgi:hypothetical protein